MIDKIQAELQLTLELLNTRKQLIEAHAQIMQYQHRDIDAEISSTQAALESMNTERERNQPLA